MDIKRTEATAGIEPANKGFADPCLTTWLRRLCTGDCTISVMVSQGFVFEDYIIRRLMGALRRALPSDWTAVSIYSGSNQKFSPYWLEHEARELVFERRLAWFLRQSYLAHVSEKWHNRLTDLSRESPHPLGECLLGRKTPPNLISLVITGVAIAALYPLVWERRCKRNTCCRLGESCVGFG